MPPFRFHEEVVRKLDDKTRRRAWRIALIRSKVFLKISVIIKITLLLSSLFWLLSGPLSAVQGAWVPLLIALPFITPFVLHRDYEKYVRPELIKLSKELKHCAKVQF
ncbi:hypothetical protein A9Q77_07795 [Marinomonas sp. 42_23_T18]|nr:hypothetical protein A9Q77_07795 [Marinomonas sp. 42_23_T18]